MPNQFQEWINIWSQFHNFLPEILTTVVKRTFKASHDVWICFLRAFVSVSIIQRQIIHIYFESTHGVGRCATHFFFRLSRRRRIWHSLNILIGKKSRKTIFILTWRSARARSSTVKWPEYYFIGFIGIRSTVDFIFNRKSAHSRFYFLWFCVDPTHVNCKCGITSMRSLNGQ